MKKIEKAAVFHLPKSSMAYAYDENTMHILLRTKKDDLKKAEIWSVDPFDWSKKTKKLAFQSISMIKAGSTQNVDFWFVQVQPKDKRINYFFKLFGEDEEVLFTERGFFASEKLEELKMGGTGFAFPWMNPVDILKIPEWVPSTIWYQVFPDRFASGDSSLNRSDILPWASISPSTSSFFGGDLQGIINHLDHLVDLGVNGLYLNPIFKAYTNHKYDTIDYFEVDPDFGNKEKFQELIAECHKRGIKVMLDAVFNHIGYRSEIWQDILKNQEKSIYKDWFFIKHFPVKKMDSQKTESDESDIRNLNYYTFAFTGYMPKINTANEEAKKYLLEVGRYWVEEFGIDAWRLDVANEVDHHFWREFRKTVNQKRPTYILGEIWNEANAWMGGDQFDGVMNYFLTSAIIDFIGKNAIDAESFKERITNVFFTYSRNALKGMFNCLSSHDTPRLLTQCNDDVDKFLLAYSFLFTCLGEPSIYYGDEIGINGGNDPECRKCMVWEKEKWNQQIFNHLKKLCQLRKTHPVLGNAGDMIFDKVDNVYNIVEYSKFNDNQHYKIYLNNSSEEYQIKNSHLVGKKNLLTNEIMKDEKVILKPNSLNIFQIK